MTYMEKRRALVMGTGISGIGAAEVLLKQGWNVVLSDVADRMDSKKKEKLTRMGVQLCFGPQQAELVNDIDKVVVSPAIPRENPAAAEALRRGIPLVGDIELAWEIAKAPILAITGTNGKTTATALLGDMIRFAGIPGEAAGNIGVSLCEAALRVPKEGLIAAELSSFQLEFIDRFRPHGAAILNITPDHFERHHTMEEYVRVKSRIFENMKPGDFILLNRNDAYTEALTEKAPIPVYLFDSAGPVSEGACISEGKLRIRLEGKEIILCGTDELLLFGKHNWENCLAAAFLACVGGVSVESIRYALKHFRGLEHRIEFVRTVRGVKYYNDSKATNTDSAIKALESFEQPVILIAGGHDKQTSLEEFMGTVRKRTKHLILIGDSSERFAEEAKRAGITSLAAADTMEHAVQQAARDAIPGDIVLLSPACSSFDMYSCYEERGLDFKHIVNHLNE